MRISTKLIFAGFVPLIVASIVGVTLLYSYRTMGTAQANGNKVRQIRSAITELNHLIFSYVIYHDERPKQQFPATYDALTRLIVDARLRDQEQQHLLEDVRANTQSMKDLFLKLVSIKNIGATGSDNTFSEAEAGFVGQLLTRSYRADASAALLRDLTDKDAAKAQQRTIVLIFLVLICATVPLTIVMVRMRKKVTMSLANLRKGTEVIGSGDLEHRLAMPAKDELGDLAQSFDAMTEKLQTVTVSKERLEQEVQERRRAEEELRVTLSSIGDAVISTDPVGNIAFMNAVAEELTGWTFRDALQQPIAKVFRIINEHTRSEVESPVMKVLREGTIVSLANHTILVRKNGTEVPIDDSGAPIRGTEGTIMGVVLVFRDITERKHAEDLLRKNRMDLEQSQEVGQIGSWRLDIRRNVLTWSDENYRIFGVPKGTAMTYETFLAIAHPDDRDYVDTRWNAALAGESYDIEHRIVVNGQVKWVREKAYLEFDETGGLLGGFGITQDISEHKRMEEELRRSHEQLELRVKERTEELHRAHESLKEEIKTREQVEARLRQSHKMEALGTLTGGIAHDFNNILAGMIGFTEMALEDASTDGLRYSLERVLQGGLRGRDLVKQMLTFSRKTEYDVKAFAITPLIEETLKLLRATIPTTIKIEFTTTAKNDIVLANATGIQQILMNLATNAAHAMRDSGGILSIILSDAYDESSPFVALTVRDTGGGMPPSILNRIFEPFFTTKEAGQGTGMGLAVVYGIVKSFGGEITVHSAPGHGTVFQVYFPRAAGEGLSLKEGANDLPTGNEKILFIDDEETLTDLGKRMLERLGYHVTATTSSTEALKLFTEGPLQYDLVITDHTMPDLVGLSLAERLLSTRPDIPIILYTGFSESLDPEKVKAAGIREYLMKPL
ncbi:MAG TPA: PAS domain S-box protein, partial [Syntrophorhabdaceae bacterium]|nr:PAS domain S-box protein [Syntrophorhabdaceae bacterium]